MACISPPQRMPLPVPWFPFYWGTMILMALGTVAATVLALDGLSTAVANDFIDIPEGGIYLVHIGFGDTRCDSRSICCLLLPMMHKKLTISVLQMGTEALGTGPVPVGTTSRPGLMSGPQRDRA